jgi:phage tail sheath gpL-like
MSDITYNEVDSTYEASGVFVEPEKVQRKLTPAIQPQKILIFGQYNSGKSPTDDTPELVQSLDSAKTKYGRGSMLAIMIEAALKTCGAVPIYACPIADDGSGVAASGTITFATTATASGTFYFYIAGRKVSVSVTTGDGPDDVATACAAAINALPDLPVSAAVNGSTAEQVDITAKWDGVTGNGITIKANLGASDADYAPGGTTATIAAMSSGANDPDISTALENFGDTQYTQLVIPYNDDTTYGAVATKGTELYRASVKKPFMAYNGSVALKSALTTLAAARNSKFFSVVPVPGSNTPYFEIGAEAAGAAARSAQLDPGRPGKKTALPGILPPSEAWDYTDRNDLVKLGISTTIVDGQGVVYIEDLCTTYTTENSIEVSAWRFVSTMTNIFNKIYQLDSVFALPPFDNCVVVDDASTTSKAYAVRPKTVKAYMVQLVDFWVDQAWSKNRDQIVAALVAEIDGVNPGRINTLVPDVIAAGGRIFAVKYEWDFNAPQVD